LQSLGRYYTARLVTLVFGLLAVLTACAALLTSSTRFKIGSRATTTALRWLVLAVVAYIAVTLLRAGLRERPLVPQTVVVRTRHEPRIWI
jgi:hypothetical protein